MDTITIIFDNGNEKTTVIAKSKDGNKPKSNNYIIPEISIDNTLEILGLERVSVNDIIPKQKVIKSDDPLIKEICVVCHEDYKCGEYKRSLNCGHIFHKKCIDKWLKTNLSCPYCRLLINE